MYVNCVCMYCCIGLGFTIDRLYESIVVFMKKLVHADVPWKFWVNTIAAATMRPHTAQDKAKDKQVP